MFAFVRRNSIAANAKPMVCVQAIFGLIREHPANGNFRNFAHTTTYVSTVTDSRHKNRGTDKITSFNIRSPLTKTLDSSVETLRRECNHCVAIVSVK